MNANTNSPNAGIADLVGLLVLVGAFDLLLVVAGPEGTPLHVLLGLPVLILAPGYAITAAMYPRSAPRNRLRATDETEPSAGPAAGALSGPTRIAVSVAASLALVGGVGMVIHLSPWLIRPFPLLAGISLVTLVGVVAAFVRRSAVPPGERYGVSIPIRSVGRAIRPRASLSFVVGVVFVASVVAAAAVVGGAATDADRGETYTEFTVLTEDGDGDLVTANYSDAIDADRPLHFALDNHEGGSADYTIVIVQETIAVDGDEATVTSVTERDRMDVQLDAGASRTVEYDVDPVPSDDPRRLHAFLYRGDAPDEPAGSSAYRSPHVWIDDPPAINGTESPTGGA